MKKFKLFFLPLVVALFLASCNSSEDKHPFVPMASLNLEISLEDIGIKLEKQGETVTDINYTMDNIASLIYVLHDGKTGAYIGGVNLPKSLLTNYTKDGVTKISERLPFGIYNVTLVVTTKTHMENSWLNSISEPYSKSVCMIPNEHIYYSSYQVDCSLDASGGTMPLEKDVDFDLPAKLDLITGEFIFMVSETNQIPSNADFRMVVEVKNVPSAFYLKTGETLSDVEMESLKLPKYEKTSVIVNQNGLESKVLAKVHTLLNGSLGASERGTASLVYKEDAKSNVETQNVSYTIPERRMGKLGHWVSLGLYSGSGAIEELIVPAGK